MFGGPWRAKSMAGQQWKPRTTTTVENRGPEKSWLHCSWARQNVQGTGGLQEEHAGGDVPWGVPSGRKSCDDPQWIRSDRGELTKNKKRPETSSLFYEVLCDDYASCNPTYSVVLIKPSYSVMNVWSFKNVRLKSQIFTSGLGYFNRGKESNEGFCHVGTRNSWEPLKKPKVLVHLKYMEP